VIALADVLDDLDELVQPIALPTCELNELLRALHDCATLGCPEDRDAPTASKLEQAFVPQQTERAEHRIRVDVEDGREVLCGRQARARLRLAIRDRAADLTRYLLEEIGGVSSVDVDIEHGASHSSVTGEGVHA